MSFVLDSEPCKAAGSRLSSANRLNSKAAYCLVIEDAASPQRLGQPLGGDVFVPLWDIQQ